MPSAAEHDPEFYENEKVGIKSPMATTLDAAVFALSAEDAKDGRRERFWMGKCESGATSIFVQIINALVTPANCRALIRAASELTSVSRLWRSGPGPLRCESERFRS